MIGVSVTCAIFLCAYGIGSGKGNPVESSLLVSQNCPSSQRKLLTKIPVFIHCFMHLPDVGQSFHLSCISEIEVGIMLIVLYSFTDYKPNNPIPEPASTKPEFPPFPPLIMASYEQLASSVAYLVPITITHFFSFVIGVFTAVTPSVIISLAYRLFVFYASTRIIPAVRENGARGIEQSPSMNDEEASSRFVSFLSQYSPSILVGVYTHLLMQHFAMLESGVLSIAGFKLPLPMEGHLWRWINMGTTSGFFKFPSLYHTDINSDIIWSGAHSWGCRWRVITYESLENGVNRLISQISM